MKNGLIKIGSVFLLVVSGLALVLTSKSRMIKSEQKDAKEITITEAMNCGVGGF